MTGPRWFFRFMYDRESAAWERRRNEPEHRELVERTAGELANVVAPPGPVADLGCGPGAHALALARRGYDWAQLYIARAELLRRLLRDGEATDAYRSALELEPPRRPGPS
jgi:hypothetical protein